MAGAGFKTFSAGEVLLASEVNTFLMQQAVMVFDSAAARDGVITAPSEGMLCYLKDTNQVEKYTGSDWVAVVEDTSPITTEGDLIVGDASGDPVRLPVGAAGEVLTSDGDTVSFVAPAAAGAFTLLSTTALTGASVTLSSIPQTFKDLRLIIHGQTTASASGAQLQVLPNAVSNLAFYLRSNSPSSITGTTSASILMSFSQNSTNAANVGVLDLLQYANTTFPKVFYSSSMFLNVSADRQGHFAFGAFNSNTAITSLQIQNTSGDFTAGTALLFGVN